MGLANNGKVKTKSIIAIPQGYLQCFITGKLRKSTPEEHIRQDILRSLVIEYGFPKDNIGVEVPIKIGSKSKRVDIAIFPDKSTHKQSDIEFIVETKRDDIKSTNKLHGIEQLESYISSCLNCKYGLWIGFERIAIQSTIHKEKRLIVQVPDIPHYGEASTPRLTIAKLVPAVTLKQVFKRIHNYIYANQGFQKDRAFEELQKIIFAKVFDEKYSNRLQFYVLPEDSESAVRDRIVTVFEKVKKTYKYIFSTSETIELNDKVLKYVVTELQRFSLLNTETDIKGEAYEELVGPNLRGDRGEFFTPRNVCDLAASMALAFFDEKQLLVPGQMKILDPAVGTGGFLISTLKILRERIKRTGVKYYEVNDKLREITADNIYGIDFNPFLVKVAQMNLVMHGDGSANINHTNSLQNPLEWSDESLESIFTLSHPESHLFKKNIEKGNLAPMECFDVIITNPPFGSKSKIDDPLALSLYELATTDSRSMRTGLPPEQLFIERCFQFLKPGGVLSIVLPDSILNNPGLTWLRKWVLRKAYLLASIDLPAVTFEPSTGTQTSILLLMKHGTKSKNDEESNAVFMASPKNVGHDRRGFPVYQRDEQGKVLLTEDSNPLIDDDLPLVTELFLQWVKEKGYL